ncbi:hypothetical protein KAU33_15805 [Candidatus Dependentiae bacterium]|nr:hypothetical protein [Candidatus Dependentiae bacterium]
MRNSKISINPLWVPHRQSPDYNEETHSLLLNDGYTSECIVCHGMCQVAEDAYYDTEEDEGPICTKECFDRYFGEGKHSNYEWGYREKWDFSDAVDILMKKQLIELIRNSFSEDFNDKFELVIELYVNIRLKE